MQIGAFVGDFIFTFLKSSKSLAKTSSQSLQELKDDLQKLVQSAEKDNVTEPKLRENAYRILIPFLATHSRTDMTDCTNAVEFFEVKMSEHGPHFADQRRRMTERRRQTFGNRAVA
jgi:hypothetical protein